MCHQTVGLVQGELERRGIVTASITLLREITRKVGPPRALALPYPLGYPLGEPGNRELQTRILRHMLELCPERRTPVIVDLEQGIDGG